MHGWERGIMLASLRRYIKMKRTIHMHCRYIYDDITALFDDDRKIFDIVNSAIRCRLETFSCHSGILQGHPTETRHNCEETWGFIKRCLGVDLWKLPYFESKKTQWTWTNKFICSLYDCARSLQLTTGNRKRLSKKTNKRRSISDEQLPNLFVNFVLDLRV